MNGFTVMVPSLPDMFVGSCHAAGNGINSGKIRCETGGGESLQVWSFSIQGSPLLPYAGKIKSNSLNILPIRGGKSDFVPSG
jgi:hypothetical protein